MEHSHFVGFSLDVNVGVDDLRLASAPWALPFYRNVCQLQSRRRRPFRKTRECVFRVIARIRTSDNAQVPHRPSGVAPANFLRSGSASRLPTPKICEYDRILDNFPGNILMNFVEGKRFCGV